MGWFRKPAKKHVKEINLLHLYVNEGNMNPNATTMGNSARQMKQPSRDAIMNSKMPEAIKKAMLENPISQPKMNHTFNLDDVSDLIDEKPIPAPTA